MKTIVLTVEIPDEVYEKMLADYDDTVSLALDLADILMSELEWEGYGGIIIGTIEQEPV